MRVRYHKFRNHDFHTAYIAVQLKIIWVLKKRSMYLYTTVCVFLQSVFLYSGASVLARCVCTELKRCRLYHQALSVTRDNVLVEEINAYFVTYLKQNAWRMSLDNEYGIVRCWRMCKKRRVKSLAGCFPLLSAAEVDCYGVVSDRRFQNSVSESLRVFKSYTYRTKEMKCI